MPNDTLMLQIRSAIKDGEDALAITLIDSDPKQLELITVFGTWLHVAATHGRLGVVQHLVRSGIDIDKNAGIEGGAAINEAAAEGHIAIVEYLLDAGSSLDVSDPVRNPLFGAIYGSHLDVVKLLVSRGIDKSVKYSGETMNNTDAATFAYERGEIEIAEYLASL